VPEFLSTVTPLMVFLGIAALGFVFLLISLIGDIFDSVGLDLGADGADGHAALDSRVISVFVTAPERPGPTRPTGHHERRAGRKSPNRDQDGRAVGGISLCFFVAN